MRTALWLFCGALAGVLAYRWGQEDVVQRYREEGVL